MYENLTNSIYISTLLLMDKTTLLQRQMLRVIDKPTRKIY